VGRSASIEQTSSAACSRSSVRRAGGQRALRLPARRAPLGGAVPRRDCDGHRPDRRAARRSRLDPRGNRISEGRERRRPADRSPAPVDPEQLR
jgi:hypothetical protein